MSWGHCRYDKCPYDVAAALTNHGVLLAFVPPPLYCDGGIRSEQRLRIVEAELDCRAILIADIALIRPRLIQREASLAISICAWIW